MVHSVPQAEEDLYFTPDAQGGRGSARGGEGYLIAVMVRCDVFRHAYARRLNSKPGPSDTFDLVNAIVAAHLAINPLVVPDFADCVCRRRLLTKRKYSFLHKDL